MVSYEKGRVYMGVWLKTDIGRRVDRVLGLMGTNPSQMQEALSATACAAWVAPHVLCLIRSSMSFLSYTFRWSIDELILHIPHFCFRGMLWDRRRQKVSKSSRRKGLDSLWHTVLRCHSNFDYSSYEIEYRTVGGEETCNVLWTPRNSARFTSSLFARIPSD